VKEHFGAWFQERVPDDWFEGDLRVDADREEILVVGSLGDVEGGKNAERAEARAGRVSKFREDTREARMKIAREAERRFRHKVSWGVTIGDDEYLFTNLSIPVMTRLRLRDRAVLDTLVDAGVARSRSHALAWCVRLVGKNQQEWIDELRSALVKVAEVRGQGPS
jgi:hypothetical protein